VLECAILHDQTVRKRSLDTVPGSTFGGLPHVLGAVISLTPLSVAASTRNRKSRLPGISHPQATRSEL